ncbi:hypothetical protein BP6252_11391 [Coleophoma cylindrospora]|uniref:Uncharacterized protein n=1 Tax=Coleophoma cylindrospora TaxID=1849047 RepID=A0A3D8QJR9_9HELO|nr:hypothetical protein BP6252_11391 [Coleophoma cylindrospora]
MSRAEQTELIIQRVLPSIRQHQCSQPKLDPRAFVLGITGLQGSGKSTLASSIVESLNNVHACRAIEVSLDDFYLTQADRQRLDQNNTLLKTRGQPGTHDVRLARLILDQFVSADKRANAQQELAINEFEVSIPVFDKSLHSGCGDRLPRNLWKTVPRDPPVQVLVFEGWCLGFTPCTNDEMEKRWMAAKKQRCRQLESSTLADSRFSTSTLSEHSLEDLVSVNRNLEGYCHSFMGPQHLDFLVHLDTEDLSNVYTWRMQQEKALRLAKGTSMMDDEVITFVKGYMPSYEMYLGDLRTGFFKDRDPNAQNKELHILLDLPRNIVQMRTI